MESDKGLVLSTWRALSPPRRSNALRAWLRAKTGRAASSNLVLRLMIELEDKASATWPVERGSVRRYRGVLSFVANEPPTSQGVPRESQLMSRALAVIRCRDGRSLQVERVKEGVCRSRGLHTLSSRRAKAASNFRPGWPGRHAV